MNYQLIHNNIIEKARNRPIKGYVEKHHIIPKCMGGTNDSENLVNLTAREHFIIHKLLVEIYPDNNPLRYGLWMMANGCTSKTQKRNYKISSREYNRLKLNFSKTHGASQKKRYEDPNERIRTGASIKNYYNNNPQRNEEVSTFMKELWKDPVYYANMSVKRSGKNNSQAMGLRVTMPDGNVFEHDTMVSARKSLGIKSYTPIYFALKNKGLHPKLGWHIQRL